MHHGEAGGDDVSQASAGAEFAALEWCADHDERDGVGGVGGVGAVVDGVPHLFGVAVVGGDDE